MADEKQYLEDWIEFLQLTIEDVQNDIEEPITLDRFILELGKALKENAEATEFSEG